MGKEQKVWLLAIIVGALVFFISATFISSTNFEDTVLRVEKNENRLNKLEGRQKALIEETRYLRSKIECINNSTKLPKEDFKKSLDLQNKIMKLKDIDTGLSWKIAYNTVIFSEVYNLDPELIISIIFVESSFNPQAKSSKGAIGLMQIMPFWAIERGTSSKYLYRVRNNIDTGMYVLNRYLEECEGDTVCALSKYHGSYPNKGYSNKVLKKYKSIK